MDDFGEREDWVVEPSSSDADARPGDPEAVWSEAGDDTQSDTTGGTTGKTLQASTVVWFVLAIGACFFISGLVVTFSTVRFTQGAERAEGEVVDFEERRGEDSDGFLKFTFAPTIEFTARGESVVFTSSTSSDPPQYDIGETVDILYNPDQPDNARIDGWFGLWFLPGLLTIVGLVTCLVALGLGRILRR